MLEQAPRHKKHTGGEEIQLHTSFTSALGHFTSGGKRTQYPLHPTLVQWQRQCGHIGEKKI